MHLLSVVAHWAGVPLVTNLERLTAGQVLIGGCRECGLTEKEFRCAKHRLERFGLVVFHGTNRGTIAQICAGLQGEQGGDQFPEVETHVGATRGANERAGNGEAVTGEIPVFVLGQSDQCAPAVSPEVPMTREETAQERQPREELVAALAHLGGTSRPQWGAAVKALTAIEAQCPNVTTAEMQRRAEVFVRKFPGAKLSSATLAERWVECSVPDALATKEAVR